MVRARSAAGTPRVAVVQSITVTRSAATSTLPGWRSPWHNRSPAGRPSRVRRAKSRNGCDRSAAPMRAASRSRRSGSSAGAGTAWMRSCARARARAYPINFHDRRSSRSSMSEPARRSSTSPSRPSTRTVRISRGTTPVPSSRASAADSARCPSEPGRYNLRTASPQAYTSASRPSAILGPRESLTGAAGAQSSSLPHHAEAGGPVLAEGRRPRQDGAWAGRSRTRSTPAHALCCRTTGN